MLEWTNPECPFVRAQYNADAMQALQKEAGAKEVVWLTVNSTNKSSGEYKIRRADERVDEGARVPRRRRS